MPEWDFLTKMQVDPENRDTDQSPLLFLSETTWRVLIAASTVIVLLLTVYSLSRGITIIFMHLYYFPIVLLAYRYRKTGFYLSVLLSLAYLGCVFYYSPWQPDVIEGAISRAIIFIGVAALIAYLSERLVKNQEMLRKVSQIQQSSLMNANVWLMLLDKKGRILVWNKAAERISGHTAGDVLGSGEIWKLLYPERDYRDMITGKITRIIGENNFFENLETTIRTKGGEHRTISWNTRGLPKKEGEEDRFIAIGVDITERLKAEEKYRSLFNNVVIGVFQTTPDGRFLSMNPALARMYGYETPEEMIRTVTEIRQQMYMHPQDRDTFKHHLATAGEVRNFISENRHRDGHPIWISINAKEVKDVAGAVLYYEGTIEDITVRKLAEEALRKKNEDLEAAYEDITATEEELRQNYDKLEKSKQALQESEQYYRTVFENTGTATVVVEENNIISLANAEFANLAGFSKEEIEGKKSWTEFVVKEDLDRMIGQHRLRRQNREQALKHYEFRFVTRSGDFRNIFLTIDVIPGTKKSVASLLDITERKQADEALRESEARFRSLFDSALDMIQIIRPDGSFLHVNPAWKKILGYSDEDISTISIFDIIHPNAKAHCTAIFHDVISGNKARIIETQFLTKDGKTISVEGNCSPELKDGTVVTIRGIFHDITERKRAEEELQKSHNELERRVEQRTNELNRINKELLVEIDERNRAEKLVTQSLHEKEMLLKEIHHRVKNNLQIIASLLNLQSNYIKDETTLNAIRDSQTRVRAMALVHEKLYRSADISRIDLDEYIRFLGTSLFQFFGVRGAGITFRTDIQDISADINTAIPLGLMMNELISNSLKHAFPDGRRGEIFVSIQRTDYMLTIEYKDTGIGIPQDLDWRNAGSLGLRLVITLVEQLRGAIELDRSMGTAFTIVVQEKK